MSSVREARSPHPLGVGVVTGHDYYYLVACRWIKWLILLVVLSGCLEQPCKTDATLGCFGCPECKTHPWIQEANISGKVVNLSMDSDLDSYITFNTTSNIQPKPCEPSDREYPTTTTTIPGITVAFDDFVGNSSFYIYENGTLVEGMLPSSIWWRLFADKSKIDYFIQRDECGYQVHKDMTHIVTNLCSLTDKSGRKDDFKS